MSNIEKGAIVRTKSPVYFLKYTDKGELTRVLTRDSGEIGEVPQWSRDLMTGIFDHLLALHPMVGHVCMQRCMS